NCNISDLFKSLLLNKPIECKRSFKFLYSDNSKIVHKILDEACPLVKKFVPSIAHSFLKGKICEWNGDAKATDNVFRIGYNYIEDKIENNVLIKKAVDVIEKRYLNNPEISGFYQVVRTCTDETVKNVAPTLIPVVKNKISSMHLDGPLIERIVHFVATVAEAYSYRLTSFWLRSPLKRFSYVEQDTREGVAKNFVDNLFHFFMKSNYKAPVLIDQAFRAHILKNHHHEINAIIKILFEASAGTHLTKAIFIAYYFQPEDETVKRKPFERKIEHLWKFSHPHYKPPHQYSTHAPYKPITNALYPAVQQIATPRPQPSYYSPRNINCVYLHCVCPVNTYSETAAVRYQVTLCKPECCSTSYQRSSGWDPHYTTLYPVTAVAFDKNYGEPYYKRNVLILTSITLIVVDEVNCNTSDLFKSDMLKKQWEASGVFYYKRFNPNDMATYYDCEWCISTPCYDGANIIRNNRAKCCSKIIYSRDIDAIDVTSVDDDAFNDIPKQYTKISRIQKKNLNFHFFIDLQFL
ncbi:hypothetical protein GJ496_010098, partial [Pomphorhynchus laevis]